MASLNKCSFIGNCGKDPEIKVLDNGDKVATVSLGVSNSYKNKKGDKVEETEWINLEFWGGLAGTVESYVKKGSPIYVEGKYKTDTWEKDGVKHYRVKIRVFDMVLLGSSKNSESPTGTGHSSMNQPNREASVFDDENEDDRLPF